ncbi:annexin A2 isoform X1 [Poecilia reticulata]|uniref:Annexin A14 n=2 Tax=Poecilia reticulata TaxID=8081 RepID=A0A3P9P543_POERE|nr:PREDICTED: annexin A2-like isoform X1 [Poecilia reticulata]
MDENFSSDMWWGTLGTIRPFPNFHPDRDAADIQAALERKDAAALVRILTNRSNAQRRAVAQSFQDETKQDLSGALKKVLSGELEELLLQLLMLPEQLEAQRLKAAMAGLGTDEETLLEILCSRSRKTLQEVAAVYRQMYNKDLEKELKAETSGDFARLVVALLNKAVTAGSVRRDVQALAASLSGKKAEAGPWINILTSRDSDHLDKVLMELELETGQTVGQLVEKRFSGDFRLGLRVLVQCIQNPEVYLAQRLLTMKTSLVQGIMVSHSEEDLLRIRAAFLRLSGSSLYSTLQKHFKGEQLLALQAVCRSED